MNKVLVALVTACVLLQGCSSYKPLSKPKAITNEVDLRTDWRRGVDGGFGEASERFNIVAEGNELHLMTNRGVIYRLNASNGRKLSSFKFEGVERNVSSALKKHGDLVFFSTFDAELIAVSLKDEKAVWRQSFSSEILADPAIAGNYLAVQTIDGWLTLVTADTGNLIWRVKEEVPVLTIRGTSSPIIADNKVIAGFADGQVKAFSLQTGKEVWSFAVGKPEGKYEIERLSDVDGRLLLSGNILYSTAYNGTVTAIDIRSGRALWQRDIGSVLSTALLDDSLIVVDQESKVIAINAKTGNVLWQSEQLVGRDLISPVVFQGHIAVMDRVGYVHLLDGSTGRLIANKLADQVLPSGSYMVPKGKQLFILTRNEQVTALTF